MNQDHPHDNRTPSFSELVSALQTLNSPAPDTGISKHVSNIVVAVALALGAWVVTGVSEVQSSVGKLQLTIDATSRSISDVQQLSRQIGEKENDMQVQQAELKQRVDELERLRGKG